MCHPHDPIPLTEIQSIVKLALIRQSGTTLHLLQLQQYGQFMDGHALPPLCPYYTYNSHMYQRVQGRDTTVWSQHEINGLTKHTQA